MGKTRFDPDVDRKGINLPQNDFSLEGLSRQLNQSVEFNPVDHRHNPLARYRYTVSEPEKSEAEIENLALAQYFENGFVLDENNNKVQVELQEANYLDKLLNNDTRGKIIEQIDGYADTRKGIIAKTNASLDIQREHPDFLSLPAEQQEKLLKEYARRERAAKEGFTSKFKALRPAIENISDAIFLKKTIPIAAVSILSGALDDISEKGDDRTYDSKRFVTVIDPETELPILKRIDIDKTSLEELQSILVSSYGAKEYTRNPLRSAAQGYLNSVNSFGSNLASLTEGAVDFSEAISDAITPGVFAFDVDKFVSDPEGVTDIIADKYRKARVLSEYESSLRSDNGVFGSLEGFTEGIGSGVGSLVQFGVAGRVGTGVANVLLRNSLVKSVNMMPSGTMINMLGHSAGGMFLNSGEAFNAAKEAGLPDENGFILALAVGGVNTIIENSIGSNRLTQYLIGNKGQNARYLPNIIIKDTGGDLSKVNLNKVTDSVIDKYMKNINTYLGGRGSSFLEEFTEEGLQSLSLSTAKVIYDKFIAPDSGLPGTGRFGIADDGFLGTAFTEAFQEAVIGGVVGGLMGGSHVDRANEKSILPYILRNQTKDILTATENLFAEGVLNEEQYNTYTDKIKKLSSVWDNSKLNFGDLAPEKQFQVLNAITDEINILEDINKLNTEVAKITADPNITQGAKEKLLNNYEGTLIRRKAELNTVRDFQKLFNRGGIGRRPDFNTEHEAYYYYYRDMFNHADLTVKRIEDFLGIDENVSVFGVENEKAADRLASFRKLKMLARDELKKLEKGKFRRTLTQDIVNKVEFRESQKNKIRPLIPNGFREVEENEVIDEKKYKLLEFGPLSITNTPVLEQEEQEQEEEEPVIQTSPTSIEPKIPDKDEDELPAEEPKDKTEDDIPPKKSRISESKKRKVLSKKKSTPKKERVVIGSVEKLGEWGTSYDLVEEEELVDGSKVFTVLVDGKLEKFSQKDGYYKVGSTDVDLGDRQVIPLNIFKELWHGRLDSDLLMQTLRKPNWRDKIIIKISQRSKQETAIVAKDPRKQVVFGTGDTKVSRFTVPEIILYVINDQDVEVPVSHINNPFKFTQAKASDIKSIEDIIPVDFSNMSMQEFYKNFTFSGTIQETEENYEIVRADWIRLKEGYESLINWYYNNIDGDNEVLNVPKEFINLKLTAAPDNVGPNEELPDMVDTEAKYRFNYVIFDTVENTHLTLSIAPEEAFESLPVGRGRYFSYVEKPNGQAGWISVYPKSLSSEEELENLLENVKDAIFRTQSVTPRTSKTKKDSITSLIDSFIALEEGLYINFRIRKIPKSNRYGLYAIGTNKNIKGEPRILLEGIETLQDFIDKINQLGGTFRDVTIDKDSFRKSIKVPKKKEEKTNDIAESFSISTYFNIFQEPNVYYSFNLDKIRGDVVPESFSVLNDKEEEEVKRTNKSSLEEINKRIAEIEDKIQSGKGVEKDLIEYETLIRLKAKKENEEKFSEKLVGIKAFESKNLIDFFAAKAIQQSAVDDETNLRKVINDVIDNYISSLSVPNLGLKSIDLKALEKIRQASEEAMLLDENNPEGAVNRETIFNEVNRLLKSYRVDPSEKDYDDYVNEFGERGFNYSFVEYSGFLTIPSEIRQFIGMTIVKGLDKYGRESETIINLPKIYTFLERNLSGLSEEEQYERMVTLSRYNPDVRAVLDKLNSESTDSVSGKSFRTRFFKAFERQKLDYIQVVASKDNNKINHVFSAVRSAPEKVLFSRWEQSFASLIDPLSVNRPKINRIVNSLKTIARHLSDGVYSEENAARIVNTFREIGIDVDIAYAKYSLGAEELVNTYGKDTERLEGDQVTNIARVLSRKNNINIFGDAGVRGRLLKIAEGASKFDSSIFETTFRAADGKIRYIYVFPNYFMTKHQEVTKFFSLEGNVVKQREEGLYNSFNPIFNFKKINEKTITDEDITNIFSNMDFVFTGDIRETGKLGVTHKDTDRASFLTLMHSLFQKTEEIDGIEYAFFIPFIVAEKRSSFAVRMPIDYTYFSKDIEGEISDKALEIIYDLFLQEYNRIKGNFSEEFDFEFQFDKFSSNENKFITVPFLNGDVELTKKLLEAKDVSIYKNEVKEKIRDSLKDEIIEHHSRIEDFLGSDDGFIYKNTNLVKFGNRLDNYIGNFVINDFINTTAYQQLIVGDLALSKDAIDRVKRYSGANAAGITAKEKIRIAYIEEREEKLDSYYGENQVANVDDAQVFVTMKHKRTRDGDFGKLTDDIAAVYDKIEKGIKITDEELKLVDLVSDKTTHYDGVTYIKKSDFALTKEFTSYTDAEGKEFPLPGRERSHNIRVWMETNNIDQLVPLSASKLITRGKVLPANFFDKEVPKFDEEVVVEIEGRNERLQVENNSKSAKGIHEIIEGTQTISLIESELAKTPEGRKLMTEHSRLRTDIREEDFMVASNALEKKKEDGLNRPEAIEIFKNAASIGSTNPSLEEFISEENGDFKYTFNLPHHSIKMEEIFLSFFNKGVLYGTAFGNKLTLVSPAGLEVLRDSKGKVIPIEVFKKDPSKYKDATRTPLRSNRFVGEEGKEKFVFAEVMMTRRTLSMLGLEMGDVIPSEALEVLGIRIPTASHQNMMAAVVVDFLPDYYGDVIITSKEAAHVSGFDYDIDSEFTEFRGVYKDRKGNIKTYGSASNLLDRWYEYVKYNESRKVVQVGVRIALANNEDYQKLVSYRNFLKNSIRNIKKGRRQKLGDVTEAKKEELEKLEQLANSPEVINDRNLFKENIAERQRILKDIREKVDQENLILTSSLSEIRKELTSVKNQLSLIYKDAILESMGSFGMASSFEQYSDSEESFPNVGALKNRMFAVKLEMLQHPSLKDSQREITTVDPLKEDAKYIAGLYDKLDSKGEVIESLWSMNGPNGKMDALFSNLEGARNIGPAAVSNTTIAYLTKNDIKIDKGAVEIDGEVYNDYGKILEDDVEGKEVRRKFSSISSVLNAMTDNAKERLAAKINLVYKFMGPVVDLIGLGIGRRRTMLLINQPIAKEYSGLLQKSNKSIGFSRNIPFKNTVAGFRAFYFKQVYNLIENINSKYNLGINTKEQSLKETILQISAEVKGKDDPLVSSLFNIVQGHLDPSSLTSEELSKAIEFSQGDTASVVLSGMLSDKNLLENSKSYALFIKAQLRTAEILQNAFVRSKYSYQVGMLSSLHRGIQEARLSSIDEIFSTTVFQLMTGDLKTTPEDFPFTNIVEILIADVNVINNLGMLKSLQTLASNDFLHSTDKYKELLNSIPFDIPFDKRNKLVRKMLTYYNMQALKSVTDKETWDSINDLLYGENTIVDRYKAIRNKDDIKKNTFLNLLRFIPEDHSENKDVFDKVEMSLTSKLDPSTANVLINSYKDLLESKSPEVREFAKDLFLYVAAKENLEFAPSGFVQYIPPELFRPMSDKLKEYNEAFNSTDSSILGKSFDDSFDDFMELFFRDRSNIDLLPVYPSKEEHFGKEAVITIDADLENGIITYTYEPDAQVLSKFSRVTLNKEGDRIKFPRFYLRGKKIFSVIYKKVSDGINEDGTVSVVYKEVPTFDLGSQKPLHLSNDTLDSFIENLPKKKKKSDLPTELPPELDVDPPTEVQETIISTKESTFDEDVTNQMVKDVNDVRGMGLMEAFNELFPDSEYEVLIKTAEELGAKLDSDANLSPHKVGAYDKSTGTIHIAPNNISKVAKLITYDRTSLERTFVHEALHHIIESLPAEEREQLEERLKDFVSSLDSFSEKAPSNIKKILGIVKNRPSEVVTYAFSSSPEFAKWLDDIKFQEDKQVKKSFWTKLKEILFSAIQRVTGYSKMDELSSIMDEFLPTGENGVLDIMIRAESFNNGENLQKFLDKDVKRSDEDPRDYLLHEELFFEDLINNIIQVQDTNLEALIERKKTASIRPLDHSPFPEGSLAEVIVNGKRTEISVVIESDDIIDINDFTKDQKDALARSLGDYKDFNDLMVKDKYADPVSQASRMFPHSRLFLTGITPARVITYRVSDNSIREFIERTDRLRAENLSGIRQYMKILEEVRVNAYGTLKRLRDNKRGPSEFRENRIRTQLRLLEVIDKHQTALEVLEISHKDLEEGYNKLKSFIKKIEEDPDYPLQGAIDGLASLGKMINGYNFLDSFTEKQIEELLQDIESKGDNLPEFPVLETFNKAKNVRDNMYNLYIDKGIDLMAEKLVAFKSDKANVALEAFIEFKEKRLEDSIERVKENKKLSPEVKKKRIGKLRDDITRLRTKLTETLVTKNSLRSSLKQAFKDVGFWEAFMEPMTRSSDQVLANFGILLEYHKERARVATLNATFELDAAFRSFIKELEKETGRKVGRDNVKKLYRNILEEVKSQQSFGLDAVQLVSMLDHTAFREAKIKLNEIINNVTESDKIVEEFDKSRRIKFERSIKLGLIPTTARFVPTKRDTAIGQFVAKWYKKHTVPIARNEIDRLIAEIKEEFDKALMTQDEYDTWIKTNMNEAAAVKHGLWSKEKYELETGRKYKSRYKSSYKNLLATPNPKLYHNPKWDYLYKFEEGKWVPKNAEGKYHEFLLNKYLVAQLKYPQAARLGNIVPGMHKSYADRFIEKKADRNIAVAAWTTLKRMVTDTFTTLKDETDLGATGLYGENFKEVPYFYSSVMSPDEVSYDITSSIWKFIFMTNAYEEVASVFADAQIMESLSDQNLPIKTNSKGRRLIDSIAAKFGVQKSVITGRKEFSLRRHQLREFIKVQFFGEAKVPIEIAGVRVDKIIDNLLRFSSISTMGGDIQKGFSQFIQANIQTFIESSAGKVKGLDGEPMNLTPANYLKGQKMFLSNATSLWKDLDQLDRKSYLGQLLAYFNPMPGNYEEGFGRHITGSFVKNRLSTDILFVAYRAGDLDVYASVLLGFMHQIDLKTVDGKTIKMIDAFQEGPEGVPVLKKEVDPSSFTDMDRFRFINMVQGLNEDAQGLYASASKPVTSRHALYRAVMAFRWFFPRGYSKRLAETYIDQKRGEVIEGNHRTFINLLVRTLKDQRNYILGKGGYAKLHPIEKANLNRTYTELITWVSLVITVNLIKMLDDDDDMADNPIYWYLLYQAVRARSETATFLLNVFEIIRILKNPSAATTTLERGIKLALSIFPPYDRYENNNLYGKKGDLKVWTTLRRFAGVSGNTWNPERVTKEFESILSR